MRFCTMFGFYLRHLKRLSLTNHTIWIRESLIIKVNFSWTHSTLKKPYCKSFHKLDIGALENFEAKERFPRIFKLREEEWNKWKCYFDFIRLKAFDNENKNWQILALWNTVWMYVADINLRRIYPLLWQKG